jgi:hypothetical protein
MDGVVVAMMAAVGIANAASRKNDLRDDDPGDVFVFVGDDGIVKDDDDDEDFDAYDDDGDDV